MTAQQMLLVLPDLPPAVWSLAFGHALAGNWQRFRDYLRDKGVASLLLRREAFDAARMGYTPELTTATEVAAAAAQGFPNLHCMECAASIREALAYRGMRGEFLDLDTGHHQGMYGNIWSDREQRVIATNGRHRAVRVRGTVFDNHNPGGIPWLQWRNDHVSPGFSPGRIPLQATAF